MSPIEKKEMVSLFEELKNSKGLNKEMHLEQILKTVIMSPFYMGDDEKKEHDPRSGIPRNADKWLEKKSYRIEFLAQIVREFKADALSELMGDYKDLAPYSPRDTNKDSVIDKQEQVAYARGVLSDQEPSIPGYSGIIGKFWPNLAGMASLKDPKMLIRTGGKPSGIAMEQLKRSKADEDLNRLIGR
jgi:hypothetical protein